MRRICCRRAASIWPAATRFASIASSSLISRCRSRDIRLRSTSRRTAGPYSSQCSRSMLGHPRVVVRGQRPDGGRLAIPAGFCGPRAPRERIDSRRRTARSRAAARPSPARQIGASDRRRPAAACRKSGNTPWTASASAGGGCSHSLRSERLPFCSPWPSPSSTATGQVAESGCSADELEDAGQARRRRPGHR